MTQLGRKERSRFMVLAEIAEIAAGVSTLPGKQPLPDLLDYSKNPLTNETQRDIWEYLEHLRKLPYQIRFKVNLAKHMKVKRKIKIEKVYGDTL